MWASKTKVVYSFVYQSKHKLVKYNGCYNSYKHISNRGFTLIELMITVTIISILAAIAAPHFSEYIQRGKLSQGLSTLSHLAVQMEKAYLDFRKYDNNGACRATAPSDEYFNYSCTGDNQSYTWTAITKDGKYQYSINQNSDRSTLLFDGSSSNTPNCWIISRDGGCY